MPISSPGLPPHLGSKYCNARNSYAACRSITRAAKSSFPLAFRLLPDSGRRAMDALYAFLRLTDDLADEPGDLDMKRQALHDWRSGLTLALTGRFTHRVHAALFDTVRRFGIPPDYLYAAIDGVEADLEPVRFATFADLYPYCYRVASVVGLACIGIWGFRDGASPEEASGPAEAAGVAFQLTNILRDLAEDRDRGRVYLPRDELGAFDCPPEKWEDPAYATCFRDMMRCQVARARDYYRQAESLIPLLSQNGRAIFQVMFGTYRELLDAIEDKDFNVFNGRIRIARWRKLRLMLAAWPVKWGWV